MRHNKKLNTDATDLKVKIVLLLPDVALWRQREKGRLIILSSFIAVS
jgi:hypothetical protein